MTITFEKDADVIVYALEKIISFARENQYLFVVNCAWWIAGIIGLDSGFTIFIDNLEARKHIGQHRICTILRDIARSVSVDPGQKTLEESLTQDTTRLPVPRTTGTARLYSTERIRKTIRKHRKKLAKV
jgi:hypothetical protein